MQEEGLKTMKKTCGGKTILMVICEVDLVAIKSRFLFNNQVNNPIFWYIYFDIAIDGR